MTYIFLQVISYIILEEAEYRLRDAISGKEKVHVYIILSCRLQCNFVFTCIIGNQSVAARTINCESIDTT